MADNFEIDCPVCEALIVIDRTSGEVLWHKEKVRKAGGSIDEMVSRMNEQKSETEKKFDKVLESQKDRSRLLEEKFKEALSRVDKDAPPPINPLDLD